MTVYAGYREISIDYDDGSGASKFELDVTMSGPIIGFEYRF